MIEKSVCFLLLNDTLGVGKGTLKLPIPASVPDGFKLLMTMCWNQRPVDRPSFIEIIKHLDVGKREIIIFEEEQEYAELTREWSIEINERLSKIPNIDISSTLQLTNEELMKKRQEELEHIADIRAHYEKRVQQVNSLYIELKSIMMQMEQRERVIKGKERSLNIKGKKRTINSIAEARKRSLEIIKAATHNLNDPINLLTQRKRYTNNQDSSNTKNVQRRKKGSGHRRNNSKGSATSWTPPSLTAIEDQEKRRVSIHIIPNMIDEAMTTEQTSKTTIQTSLPTISADVDSKSDANNRQLNPKNLKLDLQHSMNPSISSPNHQRTSAQFSSPTRRSSSSGGEYSKEIQPHTFPRQRRRRNPTLNSSKSNSPSSTTRLTKPTEIDHHSQTGSDLNKHSRNVTFQLTPSNANTQRKHANYTSSEEGEVEEAHSDSYIFDDEKHRAKHEQSYGNFSSESEIYGEKNLRVPSKTDGKIPKKLSFE